MASTTATRMTAEEFFGWADRPENAGKVYELDEGEVQEVPPPTRGHGFFCWLVIKYLTEYLARRKAGHILTNDAGIVVARDPDTLRGADVMLFLRDAHPSDFQGRYVNDVPDLIVEVVSPSDTAKRLNRRVTQYLARGVPLVWLIDPQIGTVTVCRPNEFPKVLDETDELTGNGVLPDFACRVRDLFPPPGASPPAN
jgi:Uma2 family endonuclease